MRKCPPHVPGVDNWRIAPPCHAMRFSDASHVDLGSFYARSPAYGRTYRWFGYGGIVLAMYWHGQPDMLARLLIALGVAWLLAWYRVVGALWRTSIVAAMLACAFGLTIHQLNVQGQAVRMPSSPIATETAP